MVSRTHALIILLGAGVAAAVALTLDGLAANRELRREVAQLRADVRRYEAMPVAVSTEALRQALLADPEVLVDAGKKLQQNRRDSQRQASIDMTRAARTELLAATPGLIGNPAGHRVIVEFFDFQCPHCRAAEGFLRQQAARDPELKILRREIAALGEGSDLAARAALAAARQDRYGPVSEALLHIAPPITLPAVLAAAKAAGADPVRLQADMASEPVTRALAANEDLSVRVGVTGTPAFAAPEAGTINGIANEKEFSDFLARAGQDNARAP